LNENLRGNREEPSETAGRDNYGHHPGPAKLWPKRRSRCKPKGADDERWPFAGHTTESNARRTDGTGSWAGKCHGSLAGGQTQRRSARHRRHDHPRAARPPPQALGDYPREASGRDVCAQPGAAGGNTQTQRRGETAGHSHSGGPMDSANAFANAATHHDILMTRMDQTIRDKRVLKLVGRYLRAGVMIPGVVQESQEGTPQGGPLSP